MASPEILSLISGPLRFSFPFSLRYLHHLHRLRRPLRSTLTLVPSCFTIYSRLLFSYATPPSPLLNTHLGHVETTALPIELGAQKTICLSAVSVLRVNFIHQLTPQDAAGTIYLLIHACIHGSTIQAIVGKGSSDELPLCESHVCWVIGYLSHKYQYDNRYGERRSGSTFSHVTDKVRLFVTFPLQFLELTHL